MIRRTRVKFCGIARTQDALAAAALGVDAIGVVLTRKSRRYPGIEMARQIRRSLPPFIALIALFMDDEPAFVAEAISAIAPTMLQFHGSEAAPDCVRYGLPYLKAVAMAGADAVTRWRETMALHPQAVGFVLDGHGTGEQGGSGKTFDWSVLPADSSKPLLLAGGLIAENVAAAIRAARPYAVDVSSGIESAPGIKDAGKMRRFMQEVERVREEEMLRGEDGAC